MHLSDDFQHMLPDVFVSKELPFQHVLVNDDESCILFSLYVHFCAGNFLSFASLPPFNLQVGPWKNPKINHAFYHFLDEKKIRKQQIIYLFRFKYKIDLLVKAQQLSNSIFTIFKGYQESRNQLFSRVAWDYFVPLFLLVCDCFVFVLSFLYCANFPSFCVLHR